MPLLSQSQGNWDNIVMNDTLHTKSGKKRGALGTLPFEPITIMYLEALVLCIPPISIVVGCPKRKLAMIRPVLAYVWNVAKYISIRNFLWISMDKFNVQSANSDMFDPRF